ncbi:hypothetical protein RRG08_023614 [Elysia crispata]|uniref:Uncharacterized protein n=1 Tax=Elysia crispata TaxID=231223 RepID=A0AAE0XSG3_9GAST|nr:hypothetical protein RRG08_023614 [Elysia crispata]
MKLGKKKLQGEVLGVTEAGELAKGDHREGFLVRLCAQRAEELVTRVREKPGANTPSDVRTVIGVRSPNPDSSLDKLLYCRGWEGDVPRPGLMIAVCERRGELTVITWWKVIIRTCYSELAGRLYGGGLTLWTISMLREYMYHLSIAEELYESLAVGIFPSRCHLSSVLY